MRNSERFRLRFGAYRTPRFRYGSTVTDEVRGDIVIVGITDGRIPWPVGKTLGGRARGPVVYRDLVKALARESGVAICHWWDVTGQTVSKCRRALGIGPHTAGSRALRAAHSREDWAVAVRTKALANAHR
jgi:hypothetical protein